jgi:hypothetical protein
MTDNANGQNEQTTPAPAPAPAADYSISNRSEVQQPSGEGRGSLAAELMAKKDSWYWKEGETGEERQLHSKSVAIVAAEMERRATAEAEAKGQAPEHLANTTRLANRAMVIGGLPFNEAARRDPRIIDSDPHFSNAISYFDRENISTPVVREMFTEFANGLAEGGGKVTEAWLARMGHHFQGRLRDDQIARLTRFLREEVKAVR